MPAHEPEQGYSEAEGGPTKSFLEHLEDLRWVLMKCVATIMVTFMACLLASPFLVKILTHPLKKADIHEASNNESVTLFAGTNRLATLQFDTNCSQTFFELIRVAKLRFDFDLAGFVNIAV